MKNRSAFAFAALLLASVVAPALQAADKPAADKPPVLRAGAAAVDITPKQFPLNMPGGFSANLARGAHDPLHSRALVLNDGSITVAMVVVDNLGAGPEVLNEAKAIAAKKTGIPVEQMLIASTHTHSGPSIPRKDSSAPPQSIAYRDVFINGVAESIIKAHAALRSAAIGAAAH